jgi:hypothetical protein
MTPDLAKSFGLQTPAARWWPVSRTILQGQRPDETPALLLVERGNRTLYTVINPKA